METKTVAKVLNDGDKSSLIQISTSNGVEEIIYHIQIPKSSKSLHLGQPALFASAVVKPPTVKVECDDMSQFENKPATCESQYKCVKYTFFLSATTPSTKNPSLNDNLQLHKSVCLITDDEIDPKSESLLTHQMKPVNSAAIMVANKETSSVSNDTVEFVLNKAPTVTSQFMNLKKGLSQSATSSTVTTPENWKDLVVSKKSKLNVSCKICFTETGPFFRVSRCPVKSDHSTDLHLICGACRLTAQTIDPVHGPQITCPICRSTEPTRCMIKYDFVPEQMKVQVFARNDTFERRQQKYNETQVIPKVYSCKWCSMQFLNQSTRSHHQKMHQRRPLCKICSKEGCKLCEFQLRRTCEFCKKVFATPKNLRAHQKGPRTKCQICDFCLQYFKNKLLVSQHKCPRLPNVIVQKVDSNKEQPALKPTAVKSFVTYGQKPSENCKEKIPDPGIEVTPQAAKTKKGKRKRKNVARQVV